MPEVFSRSSSNKNDDQHNRNVNYYGNPDELNKQGFKNPEFDSYVISPIDSLNKFSKSFKNCTGLVVTGIDKETGKNISFLSHQDPAYFLYKKDSSKFVKDLREQIEKLKKRCLDGTIDAVIVGGNYFKNDKQFQEGYLNSIRKQFQEDYLNSIKLLSQETENILGFEPVVMTGPKTNPGGGRDNVFYDNDHRRLYIVRPKVADESTKSYLPSDIDKQEEKW